jgi:hypothetical protein
MAMDDFGHETIRDRLHALKNGRHRNGNGGGNGGFFKGIERRVRGLETWQLLLLGAGGVLIVDHLIAPKGMSFASKAMDKLGGAKPALPPPPPPPPALASAAIAAKGMYTGANNMAGWNRGMSNYMQWPGDVWQWKPHGGPWHNWHNEPWQYGNMEYPWAM